MAPDAPQPEPGRYKAVAIGSSTGGPNLVQQIVAGLPADLPVPVFIAQHLPPKFTSDLALSMDRRSALTVVEAEDGQPVLPGTVYLGRGRMHLRVLRGPGGRVTIQVSDQPPELLYRPSVDELFRTCAQVYGRGVLGIVMTGIGSDGTRGAGEVVKAGGLIYTQSKETCAVYGMPRSCDQAGLSRGSLAPEGIRRIIHALSPSFDHASDSSSGPLGLKAS